MRRSRLAGTPVSREAAGSALNGYPIDAGRYANGSETIFRQRRAGGLDAVHVIPARQRRDSPPRAPARGGGRLKRAGLTLVCHETFRETVLTIERCRRRFERVPDLISEGRAAGDVRRARATGRTAILSGFQNPGPMEDDIARVEILHTLGARFMQPSCNAPPPPSTGCHEAEDPGLARLDRAVIAEMNAAGWSWT